MFRLRRCAGVRAYNAPESTSPKSKIGVCRWRGTRAPAGAYSLVDRPNLLPDDMRKLTTVLLLIIAALGAWIFVLQRHNRKALVFYNANSRETYFTIHNIRPAQAIATGNGVKVG